MVLFAEAIEDARDMFVAELREHVGLALKRGDRLLLHRRVGEAVDHLGQRARARREAHILGEIDHFHAAAAERFGDAVAAADYGVGLDHLSNSALASDRSKLRWSTIASFVAPSIALADVSAFIIVAI